MLLPTLLLLALPGTRAPHQDSLEDLLRRARAQTEASQAALIGTVEAVIAELEDAARAVGSALREALQPVAS